MPWQSEGDNVSFSGPLADMMGAIMAAYEYDCPDQTDNPTPGEYVTATAVVLREVAIEAFESDPEAKEFIEKVSAALSEDEDGAVHVATFQLLDDIAEHVDETAIDYWLKLISVRSAIMELATTAFA